MENFKNFILKRKNLIVTIVVFVFGVTIGVTGTLIISPEKENTIQTSTTPVSKKTISTEEVATQIVKKTNTHIMYIDGVEKILSMSGINLKKELDGVNIYEAGLKYEMSSLSAPVGQNYFGRAFYGTYYFAYDTYTGKWCKYAEKEMTDLINRWVNNKDSRYWID